MSENKLDTFAGIAIVADERVPKDQIHIYRDGEPVAIARFGGPVWNIEFDTAYLNPDDFNQLARAMLAARPYEEG